jgi:hypothetical protein
VKGVAEYFRWESEIEGDKERALADANYYLDGLDENEEKELAKQILDELHI